MISIITVSFNSGKTISKTFDSILEQIVSPTEYIIIDSKSSDDTLEIIQKYESKFTKKNIIFKWISERDDGIYHAMNKGIELSTQEWIHFLNSDDYYVNKFVLHNIIGTYLANTKNDIVYGRIIKEKNNSQSFFYDVKEKNIKLNIYTGCPIQQPATFYRSELLKNKYVFDVSYKIAADYKMFVEMVKNKEKFKFIPYFITCFSEEGISTVNKHDLALTENIRLLKECGYSSFLMKLIKYKYVAKFVRLFIEFLSRF